MMAMKMISPSTPRWHSTTDWGHWNRPNLSLSLSRSLSGAFPRFAYRTDHVRPTDPPCLLPLRHICHSLSLSLSLLDGLVSSSSSLISSIASLLLSSSCLCLFWVRTCLSCFFLLHLSLSLSHHRRRTLDAQSKTLEASFSPPRWKCKDILFDWMQWMMSSCSFNRGADGKARSILLERVLRRVCDKQFGRERRWHSSTNWIRHQVDRDWSSTRLSFSSSLFSTKGLTRFNTHIHIHTHSHPIFLFLFLFLLLSTSPFRINEKRFDAPLGEKDEHPRVMITFANLALADVSSRMSTPKGSSST